MSDHRYTFPQVREMLPPRRDECRRTAPASATRDRLIAAARPAVIEGPVPGRG